VVHRVVLLIVLGNVESGAAVLPLGEPQLFGHVRHAARVEDAGVIDQTPERLVPYAGYPVDHVTAIGSAECAHALAVQPGKLLERRSQALLQVLERLAAPVLTDGVRERLAVTGRTVEIDEDRRIARTRVGLRVPAIAPAVAERPLRAAVH